MTAATLGDHADRSRAIAELDGSIALSAGAGSGKTAVLTARVVALLEAGVDPARIAAITFTEKAAGELQERIRDAVESGSVAGRGTIRSARLAELVVCTIHAFCRRILTAEALDAGWAPDTELMPAVIQAEAVDRAFQAWVERFRAEHPVAGTIVHQRIKPGTLRTAALRQLAYRDLEPVVCPAPFSVDEAFAELVAADTQLRGAAGACLAPGEDKLLHNNRALRDLVRAAVGAPPVDAVCLVLGSRVKGKRTGGRAADWRGDGKSAYLDAIEEVERWRSRQLERIHGLVVRSLWRDFAPAVDAAKREGAVADYDDLLFRAASLLGAPGPRARLAERFTHVLIDEVQDTDPIQAEVAALITRDGSATGPWNASPPLPGRLFAVGDPRQSIYRFRRADVETWSELAALIGRRGAALTLTANFRSVPGVVDWVNAAFADLPGYVAQQAVRPPGPLPPVVRLACGPDDDDDTLAVAAYLGSLRDAQVIDRHTGSPRPLRWGDVMVLLPSWTAAEDVRATLSRSAIPCLVEGGGAFFTRDEVRLAVAALRCLEDPSDEPSCLFVLRGLFGIDWDTLARHRAAGGAWRYTVPDPPPGPVGDAFSALRALGRQRGRVSWVALLDALLERTRASVVWSALADGESRLANLDKLRALVRAIEGPAWSPGEAMRLLEALTHETEKDLSRVDLDANAVRITSYFKAKGLEAPVVVVCAAHRRREGVYTAVDRVGRVVASKVGELAPPGWPAHEARERAADEAERRRWMYVAATRARDQLVIVDHPRSTLVRQHLAAGLPLAATVVAADLPAPPHQDEVFPGFDPASVDQTPTATGPSDPTERWAARRRDLVRSAKAGSVRWRSVVEVAARERVSGSSSLVGVVGGVVVHEVMEQLDLAEAPDVLLDQVGPLVDASAARAGLDPDVAARCAGIVRRLLAHPVIARARAAPERWVEVPFGIRDRGRVVSGRIDLCFPTDGSRRSWVVADWKSDLPPRDSPGWRNYQRQLAWYAKALLATVSPCETVETVLVGPYPELDRAGDGHADGQPMDADSDGITATRALAEVHPELAPGLQALLDGGVAAPRVGADVGDPTAAVAELAWDAARVALCLASPAHEVAALRAQGWTVVAVDPVGLTWPDDAVRALQPLLG